MSKPLFRAFNLTQRAITRSPGNEPILERGYSKGMEQPPGALHGQLKSIDSIDCYIPSICYTRYYVSRTPYSFDIRTE